MDAFLSSGAEALGGMLGSNSTTRVAFRSLAGAIEDICMFIKEHDTGMAGSLLRKLSATNVVACS